MFIDRTIIDKAIKKIEPTCLYSLQEVIELKLIPNVTGYQTVYSLVTEVDKRTGKRGPVLKTTTTHIKPVSCPRPGAKILGKLYIEGKELIHFLSLHTGTPRKKNQKRISYGN